VIVPGEAGALSALGMLLANRMRDYSAGALGMTDCEARFAKLSAQAEDDVPHAEIERHADVRYAGQSYELTIPWGADFHAEHQRVYGYSDRSRATETVTLRVRALLQTDKPKLRLDQVREAGLSGARRVWIGGEWRQTPALPRAGLGTETLQGPALITDYGSTTLIPGGWSMRQDDYGNLILRRN
jgi:N-methylhydantoinase A/oxoprolinase/acetone carboxylase beta subunit